MHHALGSNTTIRIAPYLVLMIKIRSQVQTTEIHLRTHAGTEPITRCGGSVETISGGAGVSPVLLALPLLDLRQRLRQDKPGQAEPCFLVQHEDRPIRQDRHVRVAAVVTDHLRRRP